MDWIRLQDVLEAAEGGAEDVAENVREHWQQNADATLEELKEYYSHHHEDGYYGPTDGELCAFCQTCKNCINCPLGKRYECSNYNSPYKKAREAWYALVLCGFTEEAYEVFHARACEMSEIINAL